MPNGGSDCCGPCRHNGPKVDGVATHEQRTHSAFCTVRHVAVRAALSTYCANHYVDDKSPIGPMYASGYDEERIPYHGAFRPDLCTASACKLCGAPSNEQQGVEVIDEKLGALQFCGSHHYVKWWKQMHPGEELRMGWETDAGPPKESVQAAFDEVDEKLNEADIFLAYNRKEQAREVLEEVLRDGNREQQDRARAMLSRC